jgi:metalloendopeptidase OMA1, mitochondrial
VWLDIGMNISRFSFLGPAGALACLLFCSGCNTVPVTGRQQVNLMSASEEAQLGLTSFEQMKKETPISKDPEANAQLQRVGKRIAAVAQADMPNAQWEFVVFDSKEANAFCLPGGKIGVYTGILPITKDDAGLATVLGHEVAHAVARHGGERMTRALGMQAVGQAVDASTSQSKYHSALVTGYGAAAQVGVELPFSRSNESEADHIGLVYMARAGYNPEDAVKFWQRFAEANGKSGGQLWFLSTHPVDEKRIQQLKEWMPEAKKQYKPQM